MVKLYCEYCLKRLLDIMSSPILDLFYARVIGLLASSEAIKFDDVLACESAAYATAMFNPEGEMKIKFHVSQCTYMLPAGRSMESSTYGVITENERSEVWMGS